MKENWTYKKLGEVCTLITKGTTPTSLGFEFTEKGVAFIKIESLTDEGGISPSMVAHISEECNNALKRSQLEEYDILFSIAGALGRVAVVPKSILPANTNQALAIIRLIDKNPTFIQFLKHFLQSKKMLETVMGLKVGVAQQNLSLTQIRELSIPIPTNDEQSRIVSELDLLQSIIDKQQAQLKELDTLAQAVFYDMVGDPVENEKGWEIKRLEDLCEVSSSKRVLVEDVVENGIPFLRGTELTALSKAVSSKDVNFTMFITPEHYERVKSITGVPKKGDILIPSINSEGITWVVDTDDPFYFKDGRVIWVHVNTDVFASKYLSSVISKVLKANYSVLTSGATFLELKLFIIRDLVVPVPPLSLQQSFAAKIESIEKQKSAISQSIEETQKLFDYTMDKYFG